MAEQENYRIQRRTKYHDAIFNGTYSEIPTPVPVSMTRGFHIFNSYIGNIGVWNFLLKKEREILYYQRKIFSSGVGIDRYFLGHEYQDICFISAYFTGEEKEDTKSGYVMHGPKNEMEHLAFSFTKIIHTDANSDDTVKGESYAIYNTVECFDMFFKIMKYLGQRYKQDSILIIPRKGTIDPFMYYFNDGSIKNVNSDRPKNLNQMISDYFYKLDSKNYINKFTWSSVKFDLTNINPRRSGMANIKSINMRQTAQGYKFSPVNAVEGLSEDIFPFLIDAILAPTLIDSSISEEFRIHPSLRYLIAHSMISYDKKHLVTASLSGILDTFLYQNYTAGLGREPGSNITNSGDNGEVSLRFNTASGYSTEVNLSINPGSGYIVKSIHDALGMFPEETAEGDSLYHKTLRRIVRSQGERERYDISFLIIPKRNITDSRIRKINSYQKRVWYCE